MGVGLGLQRQVYELGAVLYYLAPLALSPNKAESTITSTIIHVSSFLVWMSPSFHTFGKLGRNPPPLRQLGRDDYLVIAHNPPVNSRTVQRVV